jgi:hypothetical protein
VSIVRTESPELQGGEGGKYYGVVYMRSTAERNGDAEATSVLLGRVVSKGTMNDERDSVRNKEYNLL